MAIPFVVSYITVFHHSSNQMAAMDVVMAVDELEDLPETLPPEGWESSQKENQEPECASSETGTSEANEQQKVSVNIPHSAEQANSPCQVITSEENAAPPRRNVMDLVRIQLAKMSDTKPKIGGTDLDEDLFVDLNTQEEVKEIRSRRCPQDSWFEKTILPKITHGAKVLSPSPKKKMVTTQLVCTLIHLSFSI